ncbi:hypothetical protein GGQ22_01355 [Nocardioides sp. zg-579]|uniref:Uncharacterized protein n=1 Tax=Nocardioides marmotae TaxID=2663857 RepID=A0A6I3J8W8_9ACTN|nr:nuclear transport factor 2 family protein [Nocardioides marmotae]MCR6030089.1 hypothetical protein [Gordonia jinghuaiqii]MTB93720.1 hypothetical protein [Nocardioides marmotae]QKE00064.1 nuclear transport factor 2 family protein [Nocardioides marmotae]
MTGSAEAIIAELDAKEQIRRLTADYAQGLDKRKRDQFAGVWTPDASWLPSPAFGWCHGTEEILAMADKIWSAVDRTHHFVMNHVIDVDGAEASGTIDLLSENLALDGTWSRAASTHTDSYVLHDGRWLITSRSAHVEILG